VSRVQRNRMFFFLIYFFSGMGKIFVPNNHPRAMKAGTYTGPGVPGPQLQALRGAVQQHPSQPRVPSQGALRPSPPMRPNLSGAGNLKVIFFYKSENESICNSKGKTSC
jgi:hypothetical protein